MSQYYDLEMTGPELSERLGKVLTNEQAIADETTRAEGVEATKANAADVYDKSQVYTKQQTDDAIDAEVLVEKERAEGVEATKANAADVYEKSQVYTKQQTDDAIDTEKQRAEGVESTLQENIDAERQRAEGVEATKANASDVYTKQQTDAKIGEAVAAEAEIREGADENLQEQITDIMDATSALTLTANPELVKVGATTTVLLAAHTVIYAEQITLKRVDTIINTGIGHSLDGVDNLTPAAEGNVTYKGLFKIGKYNEEITKTVYAVLPIFYGAGSTYHDVHNQASLRRTPAGTYTMNVTANGQYMFLIVPYSMTIQRITMNGYAIPMDDPVEDDVYQGHAYKMYKTANAYDAGTYEIVVE